MIICENNEEVKWAWGGLTLACAENCKMMITYTHDAHDTIISSSDHPPSWRMALHAYATLADLLVHAALAGIPAPCRGSNTSTSISLFPTDGTETTCKDAAGHCAWLCHQQDHWSSSHARDSKFPFEQKFPNARRSIKPQEDEKHHRCITIKQTYTMALLCIMQQVNLSITKIQRHTLRNPMK